MAGALCKRKNLPILHDLLVQLASHFRLGGHRTPLDLVRCLLHLKFSAYSNTRMPEILHEDSGDR